MLLSPPNVNACFFIGNQTSPSKPIIHPLRKSRAVQCPTLPLLALTNGPGNEFEQWTLESGREKGLSVCVLCMTQRQEIEYSAGSRREFPISSTAFCSW